MSLFALRVRVPDLLALLLLTGGIARSVEALDIGSAQVVHPFFVVNQNPLASVLGLPASADANIADEGELSWFVGLDWASHSIEKRNRREHVFIDGETTQLNLAFQYGFAAHWQWGVYLPLRYQGGGMFDQMIYEFHRVFGMPQGARRTTPHDHLNYRYSLDGEVLFDYRDSGGGLGDMHLLLAHQLADRAHEDYNLTWHLDLKLPSGDEQQWLGNGALALSSALAMDLALDGNWQSYGHLGLQYSERGAILADQQHQMVAYGGFGLSRQYYRDWQLKAQFDISSALYSSDLLALGPAAQLTFGVSYLQRGWQLDISALEDIVPSTAPDIVFKVDFRRQFLR
jgi:hypothetical protein